MSALATPFIHPTASGSVGSEVNIELVTNISVVDIPAFENTPAKYLIVFSFDNDPANDVTWTYLTSASRNTSRTNIRTFASTAIA
jgi:hypothetical protein